MLTRIVQAAARPLDARARASRFVKSDQGIAITEYGLLVTFIAILVIGVIVLFGGAIQSWFGARTGAVTTY